MTSRFLPVGLRASVFLLAADAIAAPLAMSPAADEHFLQGVECYQSGRYDEAIDQFAYAYEASHDYRYLYNLGQANAARWRPVEALAAFERYTREATGHVSAQRRQLVAQAMAQQRARIAWLDLRVSPHGATIRIDGREAGKSPLLEPLPVAVGEHVVSVSSEGYQSLEQRYQLQTQQRKQIEVTLVPNPPPLPSPRLGQVMIECLLPEVEVFVDELRVGTTPLEQHLVVAEGPHALRFERIGYRRSETTIRVLEPGLSRASCDMQLATPLSPVLGGKLLIHVEPMDLDAISISIDGKPGGVQTTLPNGLHRIELQREGFVPLRRDIRIMPGKENRLWVQLQPTAEHQRELRNRAQAARNWAYGVGATGVVSLGAALSIGIWNQGRHAQWHDQRASLEQQATPDPSAVARANDLLRSVHTFDLVTACFAVAGGVMLAGAAVMFSSGENPDRYTSSTSSSSDENSNTLAR